MSRETWFCFLIFKFEDHHSGKFLFSMFRPPRGVREVQWLAHGCTMSHRENEVPAQVSLSPGPGSSCLVAQPPFGGVICMVPPSVMLCLSTFTAPQCWLRRSGQGMPCPRGVWPRRVGQPASDKNMSVSVGHASLSQLLHSALRVWKQPRPHANKGAWLCSQKTLF